MRGGRKPDVRRVTAGTVLTEQGHPGGELYLLLDGVVSVEVDGSPVVELGPGAVLGDPPAWYKSFEYRSRVVREPRAVLTEFGMELSDDVEVRVVDSTSEQRYMVLPMRPDGTDDWTPDELAALVTRNSMIGTGTPLRP